MLQVKEILKVETGWEPKAVSNITGKEYQPHNDEERIFVYDDVPKFALLKGGWGSGKSTAGVASVIGRLARGMNCIAVSPDLQHFKKSLWPVLREWLPWGRVVKKHQYKQKVEFEPGQAGILAFENGAVLYYGGVKDATSWFGGNVHFALFDEAARYPDADAFKSLAGRVRLMGPHGEPPQLVCTTTPDMNWLYDYFGPIQGEDDPFADFKREALVCTILTQDNLANLDPAYVQDTVKTLTGAEAELYLAAQWVRVASVLKFLDIIWWDACREDLPPLGRSEPMVLGVDAAKGGETNDADCFAVVGVTRHPQRHDDTAVRYAHAWQAEPGKLLDFLPIEEEIRRLCREFSVVEVAYDQTQLHDMMSRLKREGVAFVREFSQASGRLVADNQLRDVVMARRFAHDGNPMLRKHIDNANMKREARDAVRIVKRTESLKIDLAVALSMSNNRSLYYNLS